MAYFADGFEALVVGHGLAGLVAACELAEAGHRVAVIDQENAGNIGGQAYWSFGGLFMVDSAEQRRMRIKDSLELALLDWRASAGWDRLEGHHPEDQWAQAWGEAFVHFAAEELREWITGHGVSFFPVVGWAERGGSTATGHGNSVPRFHIPWGTGTGLVAPFARKLQRYVDRGLVRYYHRHRVDELIVENSRVVGVRGAVLATDDAERGVATNRAVIDDFEFRATATLLATGGIGANPELVRSFWPERLGTPPQRMISGVPAHVDGRMLAIAGDAGARLVNQDRMWHYVEGIKNWNPIWERHGIRILPGPSSLWLDATGHRLSPPALPGFDTLATLAELRATGYDHSWFVLNQKIIEKEFALSGSEQNPDLTGKDLKLLLKRLGPGAPGPVEAFKNHGEDFVVADTLDELLTLMQELEPEVPLDTEQVQAEVRARDLQLDNPFSKDAQITFIRSHRASWGDKLIRVAPPGKLTDPANGPLIAVRLNILTRKTLGGIQTDLNSQALDATATPIPGLYAAGEAAGFGGGGSHGYRALEGTFVGGCLFTGRTAGRAMAAEL
ncbi:FAD-binding dehydrogenase [Auritidibacter ignavus]|uniref:FAD-binding dehydrogenase n=1 Tax=Auritidibacter ignavus TaxID=678932 RepID=A0AAJ6DCA5_9MICC|nr:MULTISPECIES: FAD-binding dehydrogenase [Auritidibacter]PXA81893.1 FAD-binding dehydrogenase [Auritidibacter sp. NML120636]WGH81683.1 FAD-binding dehydrogenase [Auritidibacter ignavus]WGH93269.1 FAD-binding dehydrogenase [Auritidibacter ignavus]WHS35278.1 FAD-binding dehydrogenase [Auritidibacter ignavus]